MSALRELRTSRWAQPLRPCTVILAAALFPFFVNPLDSIMDDSILILAYVVMALGLNLVVGFAGLLDLGFVAFYAFGLLVTGWWASTTSRGWPRRAASRGSTSRWASSPRAWPASTSTSC